VADDAIGANCVTLLNIAHERNQGVDLRRRERLIGLFRVVAVAEIDELDSYGAGIERRDSLPIARACMPGPPLLRHESVDRGRIAASAE
jgi:hypothetical protein